MVIAEISVSLDGFVTGPQPDLKHGLGRGGEALHRWALEGDDVDTAVLKEATSSTGAIVMGRKLYDFVDGPNGWNDKRGYGADQAAPSPPAFVLTHQPPLHTRLKGLFTFVTDGLPHAISQALEVAGDKHVVIMGGAEAVREAVEQGVADELVLHIAPVLLGAGTPLFVGSGPRSLVQTSARTSRNAVHVRYRIAQ